MHNQYKYGIFFPVPDPFNERIRALIDDISAYTGQHPPYLDLPPHVTFHKPIRNIDERTVLDMVYSAKPQIRKTRIAVQGLTSFGKHYIVLPVHAMNAVAQFWVTATSLLSMLPEYEHGPHDRDNTLHITVAKETSDVFDEVWPRIRSIPVEPMDIPVEQLDVYRKPIGGGAWELRESFSLLS